jgi:large subunit ribosomal protein L24
MSKWIKKGDKVVVIAGNEKGRSGEVLSIRGDKVIIQGLNIRKKHVKRRAKAGAGEIIEIEKPIHISNVSICDEDLKPVKIKVRTNSKGEKELFFINKDKEVLHRVVGKTNKQK